MAPGDRSTPRSPQRPRRSPPFPAGEPRVRRGSVRIPNDIAFRVRAGHPWIFREALGDRVLRERPGDAVDVLDAVGGFVARGIVDPTGPVAVRVFSRDPSAVLDSTSIPALVERARRLRERFLPPGLSAYRVIHGEGDGLPGVTVDRYGEYLVAHVYSAAIAPHLEIIRDALLATYRPAAIYEQQRQRPQTGEGPRQPAQLVRGAAAPPEVEVREDQLAFAVDVSAPLGTGLFLDLRDGRAAVARLVAGRRVLNLFSYTGAFSLYAAKAGAREVVSVDLSSKAHGRARRNLQLNGMSETGHEFVVGDAIKVVARFAERRRPFDVIIVDPPSFAQAGGRVFVAHKDYRDLVEAALSILEPGGLLVCASNTAKLPPDEFDRILGDGAGRARRTLQVIARAGLPPDFPVPAGFPEGQYLKLEIAAAP